MHFYTDTVDAAARINGFVVNGYSMTLSAGKSYSVTSFVDMSVSVGAAGDLNSTLANILASGNAVNLTLF